LRKKIVFIVLLLFFSGSLAAETTNNLMPGKLVALAVSLNNQMRYTEAADLLERALMLEPTVFNGMAEYRKALAGMNLVLQAKNEDVSLLDALMWARWQTRKKAYVQMGSSTNINYAPTASLVPLTIGGSNIIVVLSDDDRPKERQAIEVGASAELTSKLSNVDRITASVGVMHRGVVRAQNSNYQWGKAEVNWQRELPAKRYWLLGAALDILDYEQQQPFYVLQGALRYSQPWRQKCTQQFGIDIQHQGQLSNNLYDGYYIGVASAFSCLIGNQEIGLQLSLGQDWALDKRQGGDQVKARFEFTHAWDVGRQVIGDELQTTVAYYQQEDKEGYSSALSNNRKREVKRFDLSVQYAWPLYLIGESWMAYVSVEWTNQRGNILLFETDTKEIWLGVKKSWQ